ncbi:unnamed protein product [Pylaiella littoralis]
MAAEGKENPHTGEGESTAPSREEFNTAIGDLSAKLESLMTSMSRVVQGAAPAAAGEGGESRGGRHTVPGAGQQGGLDQAPNTGETRDWQRHQEEPASSVGDVSRESASGELLAHQASSISISSRTPRLRQLDFDGKEENWPMFQNDFLTQVHACGMMSCLKDSRDISVHGLSDEEILDQGLQQTKSLDSRTCG